MITIQKYSFLILLASLYLSLYFIYAVDINMTIASLISLVSSCFIFIIHVENKKEEKHFKILNILVLNIFIIFQFFFVLMSLYASPDYQVYSLQSSAFLLCFSLSLSSMFFYTKKNIFKIKSIFSFLYFLIASFLIISFTLVYNFSNPSNVSDSNASFLGLFSLFVLIASVVYLKVKINKNEDKTNSVENINERI